ncbi:MAG: Ig-like domain-containing protein [Flavobacteriaceae bacterium]|jgi:hypothetical protein|nr:Ig-like domain-containing protein [Flavobacteriaceae bacterium]
MKKLIILLLSAIPLLSFGQKIFTEDVNNFWNAYDKIVLEKDSLKQLDLIKNLYINKGTSGLEGIMRARRYSAEEYVYAINHYPKFWQSVRNNTLKSKEISKELVGGIEKLKEIYPNLKPVNIYFEIGILRTPGTAIDGMAVIGSEVALTNKSVITSEFDNVYPYLRTFFDTNPIKDVVFLNVHEYVHTQQNLPVDNLLSYVIYEGVAEFVAVKALEISSPNPQIEFGKNNAEKIKLRFEEEMFYINNRGKWLWSNDSNEFGMRDLGYYVGYQMCENFYEQAENKKGAIKTMIELDYTNDSEIDDFVKKSNYFLKSLDELYQNFEAKRPTVIGIKQFENNSKNVSPNIKEITVEFSEPLNGRSTGVDFGDLGQDAFPKNDVTKRFWSEDRKSWTISVDLEPNKKYQILISNNFRTENGTPLKAFLIEFETGN